MLNAQYSFREIYNHLELLEHFRLRYEIFSQCDWYKCSPENKTQSLDVDDFDRNARHFGLFKRTIFGKEVQVGTVRFISLNENRFAINCLNNLGRLNVEWKPAFAISNYHPHVFDLLKKADDPDLMDICEPSRFGIKKGFRSMGLANFFLEAIIVFVTAEIKNGGVLGCDQRLSRFYRNIGFTEIGKFNIHRIMRMPPSAAFQHISDLNERMEKWRKCPTISCRIARFTMAEFHFLLKKYWNAISKKISPNPVTSPRQQVQMAN